MGLIPSSKIVVSSVATNLAGVPNKRTNYLKSLIIGTVLTSNNPDIAASISKGIGSGPGSRMFKFMKWAEQSANYGWVGLPTARITGIYPNYVDRTALKAAAYPMAPILVNFSNIQVGGADPYWWARKWVEANHMTHIYQPWKCDYNYETGVISINYPGNWSTTITPTDFDLDATYLYADFYLTSVPGGSGGGASVFIYEVGSGNTDLDNIATSVSSIDYEFYPFIPIRSFGTFYTEANNPAVYGQITKATKKAMAMGFEKIVDALKESDDLDEMDFAYIVFGVGVTSKSNACKKYIYNFFKMLADYQAGSSGDNSTYVADLNAYRTAMASWEAWKAGGSVGPEPAVPAFPKANITELRINTQKPNSVRYDVYLRWRFINESTGSGLKKPGAKAGDLWFDTELYEEYNQNYKWGSDFINIDDGVESSVILNWQVTDNSWKSLLLVGVSHHNYIYGAKSVDNYLAKVLQDDDENMGFIVPLHEPTLKAIGAVNAAQVSTECVHVVINCYEEYTTGFLGYLLPFLSIASFIVGAALLPASVGLLGSNIAVGSALGLSATSAALVGAIVNAVAAVIVMNIVQKISVAVFGEKIGAIIGAVVGFVTLTVGSSLMNGQSLSTAFGNMMRAESLISLTSAVGDGVAGYINGALQDLAGQMEQFQNEMDQKSRDLSSLYAQNIGYDRGMINPMSLTDAQLGNFVETSAQFLTRTLLTGTDIAQISMNMLTKFTDITLSTDLPLNVGD